VGENKKDRSECLVYRLSAWVRRKGGSVHRCGRQKDCSVTGCGRNDVLQTKQVDETPVTVKQLKEGERREGVHACRRVGAFCVCDVCAVKKGRVSHQKMSLYTSRKVRHGSTQPSHLSFYFCSSGEKERAETEAVHKRPPSTPSTSVRDYIVFETSRAGVYPSVEQPQL
jgi:ssDNA-binding Zn-finger/Zn-ribbon topoisomerase 1